MKREGGCAGRIPPLLVHGSGRVRGVRMRDVAGVGMELVGGGFANTSMSTLTYPPRITRLSIHLDEAPYPMDRTKKTRLAAAGWRVGSTEEFLSLSETERAMIDIRVHLARTIREERVGRRISQTELADRIGSSQSRVAKMEAGDPSVSLDLLVRTLIAAGTGGAVIAAAFRAALPKATPPRPRAG